MLLLGSGYQNCGYLPRSNLVSIYRPSSTHFTRAMPTNLMKHLFCEAILYVFVTQLSQCCVSREAVNTSRYLHFSFYGELRRNSSNNQRHKQSGKAVQLRLTSDQLCSESGRWFAVRESTVPRRGYSDSTAHHLDV